MSEVACYEVYLGEVVYLRNVVSKCDQTARIRIVYLRN
jgi:hypothetical protein